jgi:hypothetical protein
VVAALDAQLIANFGTFFSHLCVRIQAEQSAPSPPCEGTQSCGQNEANNKPLPHETHPPDTTA